MSVDAVFDQLEEHARQLYRKAIDADARLDKLKAEGLGKFQAIFKEDQGFTTQSSRFMPYVEELGKEIIALKALAGQPEFESQLKTLLGKMQLLFTTLSQFKSGTSH